MLKIQLQPFRSFFKISPLSLFFFCQAHRSTISSGSRQVLSAQSHLSRPRHQYQRTHRNIQFHLNTITCPRMSQVWGLETICQLLRRQQHQLQQTRKRKLHQQQQLLHRQQQQNRNRKCSQTVIFKFRCFSTATTVQHETTTATTSAATITTAAAAELPVRREALGLFLSNLVGYIPRSFFLCA